LNSAYQNIFKMKTMIMAAPAVWLRGGGVAGAGAGLSLGVIDCWQAAPPHIRDIALSAAIMLTSVGWLQMWIQLAKHNKVETSLARKIIHTGSGPLFVALWPFYSSDSLNTRIISAAVPILTIVNLLSSYLKPPQQDINNLSANASYDLVDAISRGDRSAAVRGPLIYSFVLAYAALTGFR
jgi:phytol kinase